MIETRTNLDSLEAGKEGYIAVSYTHLDVYKRQIDNDAVYEAECEAHANYVSMNEHS